MSKFCMSCGGANPDSATACLRCGKELIQSHPKPTPAPTPTPLPLQSKPRLLFQNKKIIGYGILVVLCIVVVFVVMNFWNRGIVGTWKTDEFVSGDYRICNTIKFNSDNTGFFTCQLLHINEETTFPIEWQEIDGNKYMIICEDQEIVIELGSDEFVIEEAFASADKENIIYHRD